MQFYVGNVIPVGRGKVKTTITDRNFNCLHALKLPKDVKYIGDDEHDNPIIICPKEYIRFDIIEF